LQRSIKLRETIVTEDMMRYNTNLSALYETDRLRTEVLERELLFSKNQDSLLLVQAMANTELLRRQFEIKERDQTLRLKNTELSAKNGMLLSNKQRIDLLSKDKDLQQLEVLRVKALAQAEQLDGENKQRAVDVLQSDKLLQTAKVKTLTQQNELTKLRQRQTLLFSLLGIAAMLLTGVYLYFLYQRRQAKMQLEMLTKEEQFSQTLADESLRALRSQMNPHFIFNSLNSINSVVVGNNIPLASDYLTKFSKLIRLILDNSTHQVIPLAKELETLRLYLLMEGIRFSGRFDYTISVDEELDAEHIKIPPTTLQPFVENAIVHGLMHVAHKGNIAIDVRYLTASSVQISIQDNGIGRQKSAALKSTTNKHKSHGLEITTQRISKMHPQNVIRVLDLVDESLIATGTKVIIDLHYGD
jgi:hypothetical protein